MTSCSVCVRSSSVWGTETSRSVYCCKHLSSLNAGLHSDYFHNGSQRTKLHSMAQRAARAAERERHARASSSDKPNDINDIKPRLPILFQDSYIIAVSKACLTRQGRSRMQEHLQPLVFLVPPCQITIKPGRHYSFCFSRSQQRSTPPTPQLLLSNHKQPRQIAF